MFENSSPSQPTTGAPQPPWRRTTASPAPAFQPVPEQAIPRPAPVHVPTPAPVSAAPATPVKDWGPLKPIRTVPKPTEAKAAYVLAQTTPVRDTDERSSIRKRWIIIGSVIGIVLVAGGTLAFVFFGRKAATDLSTPSNQPVYVVNVNTTTKNGNVNTASLFPNANASGAVGNTNAVANANTAANTNATLDSDRDGLTDQQEALYGTDPKKADTDGDGYTDGQEVQSGYNPLGPGKL